MRGRTIILVSHHVQLCAPGAKYIVSLDNGRVQYSGDYSGFEHSDLLETLMYAKDPASIETKAALNPLVEENVDAAVEGLTVTQDETSTTPSITASDAPTLLNSDIKPTKKPPRKLVEDEKREVGGINRDIWTSYLAACGGWAYWVTFAFAVGIGATAPVLENGWLRCVICLTRRIDPWLMHSSGFGRAPTLMRASVTVLPITSAYMRRWDSITTINSMKLSDMPYFIDLHVW